MKNAYLILTDLHYAVSKEHRINYLNEVLSILQQSLAVQQKYRDMGYRVFLIFLGDIIDGPIQSSEDALRCQVILRWYCATYDGAYAVLGNHEINNYSSNPFWFLVDGLEDAALSGLQRPLQPQGLEPVLRVPDVVHDGDLHLYFNHYGISSKIPVSAGVNIGLFHQNVGSNDICKMWGTFADVEEASFVQAYNYLFFGHMHLANGKYKLNEAGTCVGEWLGSCVGTTVVEVETLPSKLNIPAILSEDGRFISVEDNPIDRSNPSEVIDYTRLDFTKKAKEAVKEKQKADSVPVIGDSLFSRIKFAADGLGLGGIIELLSSDHGAVLREYREGLNAINLKDGDTVE